MVTENTVLDTARFVKGIKILLCITIVNLVCSFLPSFVAGWPEEITGLVGTITLLWMSPLNGRYKKAGVFRLIMLLCTLLAGLRYVGLVFSLAGMVLSFMATYQQYRGHAEITYEKDLNLSDRWGRLFEWTIILAFLLGFLGAGAAWLLGRIEMQASLRSVLSTVVMGIPNVVVGMLHVGYLRQTIKVFAEDA